MGLYDELAYLLLVLSNQNILVVNDHSLKKVFCTGHVLSDESLGVILLLLLELLILDSLAAGDGGQGVLLRAILHLLGVYGEDLPPFNLLG